MKFKRTKRVFRVEVPDGTELQKVRTFLRDKDGAEHPVDKEIEVPRYRREEQAYVYYSPSEGGALQDMTERAALDDAPPGSRVASCEDVVDFVELGVPEPPGLQRPEAGR